MLEWLLFALALASNLLLIAVFVLRRNPARMGAVRRVGIVFLLLAIPVAYALYLSVRERAAWQYALFLGITLVFMALEAVYDFLLRVPFRRNWKLATPYIALYYAMNYGFVVMVWERSLPLGILVLALFVVQIVANALSHPRGSAGPTERTGGHDQDAQA